MSFRNLQFGDGTVTRFMHSHELTSAHALISDGKTKWLASVSVLVPVFIFICWLGNGVSSEEGA